MPPELKPSIETNLILHHKEHNISIRWHTNLGGAHHSTYEFKLSTEQSYEFTVEVETTTIAECEGVSPVLATDFANKRIKLYHLAKVRDGDRVLYNRELCKKHQCRMKRVEVPIHYGLPDFDPEFEFISNNAPNAREYILGGCCQMPRKSDLKYVCPECKKAVQEWSNKQSK